MWKKYFQLSVTLSFYVNLHWVNKNENLTDKREKPNTDAMGTLLEKKKFFFSKKKTLKLINLKQRLNGDVNKPLIVWLKLKLSCIEKSRKTCFIYLSMHYFYLSDCNGIWTHNHLFRKQYSIIKLAL